MSSDRQPPPAARGSDLKLRLVSAVVMMAVALAAIVAGGTVFAAFVAIGSSLFLLEWSRITGPFAVRHVDKSSILLVAVSVFAAAWDPVASLAVMAVVAAAMAIGRVVDERLPWLGVGIVYSGFPGVAAVAIRGAGDDAGLTVGMVALAFVFVIVWATDSAAYFVGRAVGGPKLWERISPKKTWSGAIGGLAAGIAAGVALIALSGLTTYFSCAVIAAILSIASQGGDLLESAVKRHFGVKDSGSIIPGHGGIMDRVDGLVVALAVAAVIGYLRADGGAIATGLVAG